MLMHVMSGCSVQDKKRKVLPDKDIYKAVNMGLRHIRTGESCTALIVLADSLFYC